MMYFIFLFMLGLVLGLIAVASNPSPYFAALGLVVAAAAGCWAIMGFGAGFLSLTLFLIYLGGMLVVFAYSAALAAEPYPEAWGSWSVIVYILMYLLLLTGFYLTLDINGVSSFFGGEGWWVLREDWSGVASMYFEGGWMLLISGWMLLMTLYVVLELTRGLVQGALRAV
uniref:NADH-ubiquinone oxidoreductase chain 6 n=1 Tax=Ascaphus truei TaxID=8439 RepID=Q2HQT7_ASCTR|nr:NADH dehydrogenase subunit 6 [Ascaphus truei]